MPRKSGWEVLQSGDLTTALKLLQGEDKRDSCIRSLVNLGICYLMLGETDLARKTFDIALQLPPRSSGTHSMAGIASWIANERTDAVRVWYDGLDAPYRDAAGGIELPLLRFANLQCFQ